MCVLSNGIHEHNAVAPAPRPHLPSKRDSLHSEDREHLRCVAWALGEQRALDAFAPTENHVGLGMVNPHSGFAHWRIRSEWVDETAWRKGSNWKDCRLVLRLYDVSCIEFNGLNAHAIHDQHLPRLCGQAFFKLSRPGTWQIGEVGFVLKSGEFVPAARSRATAFPREAASNQTQNSALLVDGRGRVSAIGNIWDQERILCERRQPRLRTRLRIAALALTARAAGDNGTLGQFVSELATGQAQHGHDVHVFLPASPALATDRIHDGVHYHILSLAACNGPLDSARSFARAAEERLSTMPKFDLVHQHEWMTALTPWLGACPRVFSCGSIESTRRSGGKASDLSLAIEEAERHVAENAACILTPPWLHDRLIADWGVDSKKVHPFPLEGRLPNEWECPLDLGRVKEEIGLGPLDRLIMFVGPLEHAAGVDLLLDALPVLLQRAGNLRCAFVGMGMMWGQLHHRMHQLGVAHAVRLLGHVDGARLTRLLRAAEALVLPSRCRAPQDDAVVDLARHAGRPVISTHGGPAHLVRHEETGIVTYDNPGSMVWAIDRILGDPHHAQRMGQNGQRNEQSTATWSDVARLYMELCARVFPSLQENCDALDN